MINLEQERFLLMKQFLIEGFHWQPVDQAKCSNGTIWHTDRCTIEFHVQARILIERLGIEAAAKHLDCNREMLEMFADPDWVAAKIKGEVWHEEELTA